MDTIQASAFIVSKDVLDLAKQNVLKIESLKKTIEQLKDSLEEAGATCSDCSSVLERYELEEGYCMSCARLLS